MSKDLSTPPEIERACLAGFLKWPKNISDYLGLLSPSHFYNRIHAAIYSAITNLFKEIGNVDQIMVAEKLSAIGLTRFEDLNILDYIESLSYMNVKEEVIGQYVANILKYNYARKVDTALDTSKKELRSNIDQPLGSLVNIVDRTLEEAGTENIADEDKPIDVFTTMPYRLIEWAENPKPMFLKTPFDVFTKMYGGFSFGDLYVIAAGPKVGKSTMVNYFAYEVAGLPENNCLALVLDTELETDRIIARNLSSLSGVNEYKIKTGKFLNNISDKNKVFSALNSLEKYQGKVHHKYVANKSIDEVISIARRWYAQNVKNGENVLIVYDYLKSTQENIGSAFQSFELLGMKTDKLKKLASELPRTACLTAVQTNRQNQAAMSSQIEWFCSNMYRLEKKSPEEITASGKDFGTHKLIEVRARVQGEEAAGADNYILKKTAEGNEYVENYINFKIENFKVTECGTALDMYKKGLGQINIDKGDKLGKEII